MSDAKKQKIGWLGAGRMGYDMAKCLAKAGYDITVWNRTRAKAEPLTKEGAKIANHPSELASCDVIFSMLATADDVNAVILGPEPQRAIEQLEEARRAGYNHITVRFPGKDLATLKDQISAFSENVMGPLRAVIPN